MNNTQNIYDDFDTCFSVVPFDDYPEEECPYSCSEEAEAAEALEKELTAPSVILFTQSFDDRAVFKALLNGTVKTDPDDNETLSPWKLVSGVVQSSALDMMRTLRAGNFDGNVPVVIELYDSAILDENLVGLFLTSIGAEMDESWTITVIWKKPESVSDCFLVKPILVEDIISGKFYSLGDMRTEEVIIQ